jgi:HSP20 family protein
MPARDANRGRGGGRGRAGKGPSSAGARQAKAGASTTTSTTSTHGGSSGGAQARGGESSGGRASSRTTRTAQPSRTSGAASASSGRAGAGGASSPRSGGGASRGARGTTASPSSEATGSARSAAGVSSGIAGGDIASGGMATTGTTAPSTPRAADIGAGPFGGGSTGEAPRTSDRQRDLEPIRESRGTPSASAISSGASQVGAQAAALTGTQASAGVAGRPQPSRGLSSWLAGAENPLAMMRRIQEDLDTVFRAFGVPRFGAAIVPPRNLEELLERAPTLSQTAKWSPQIEVFERDGDLVVHADLPGVKREDVEVSVGDDVLTIRGERRQENRETQGGYRRTERGYGTFFRQIPLPDGVDPTEIEAAYEDGVLEVIIPSPRDVQRGRRRVDIR